MENSDYFQQFLFLTHIRKRKAFKKQMCIYYNISVLVK